MRKSRKPRSGVGLGLILLGIISLVPALSTQNADATQLVTMCVVALGMIALGIWFTAKGRTKAP